MKAIVVACVLLAGCADAAPVSLRSTCDEVVRADRDMDMPAMVATYDMILDRYKAMDADHVARGEPSMLVPLPWESQHRLVLLAENVCGQHQRFRIVDSASLVYNTAYGIFRRQVVAGDGD